MKYSILVKKFTLARYFTKKEINLKDGYILVMFYGKKI